MKFESTKTLLRQFPISEDSDKQIEAMRLISSVKSNSCETDVSSKVQQFYHTHNPTCCSALCNCVNCPLKLEYIMFIIRKSITFLT